jgi:arylsulfatase A-like enzyme
MIEASRDVDLPEIPEKRYATFALACWFALATSIGELVILAVEHLAFHRELHLSRDLVWMIPAADLSIFLFLSVGLGFAGSVFPPSWRRRIQLIVYGFVSVAGLLFMVPGLATLPALLLALGIAVQFSRMVRRKPGFNGFVRRSLLWQATGFALAISGYLGFRAVQEWRSKPGSAVLGAPNVLLIVLDTARALSMSLYGYGRTTTPSIDTLARNGAVFTQAWAPAPWTLPSHASMFTGRQAFEHGADWTVPLDGRFPVIAEAFGAQGYATGGFAANAVYCGYESGLTRGFQHFTDYVPTIGEIFYSSSLIRRLSDNPSIRRLVGYHDILGRQTAGDVNRHFLGWLDGVGARPFFAFLNYFDAHGPILPPAPYDTMFSSASRAYLDGLRHWSHQAGFPRPWDLSAKEQDREVAAYDAAIAYMDAQVGRLMAELKSRNMLKNTIVIVTADHGEMFGENGVYSHGNSLYRPVLWVPLVMIGPGSVPAGRLINAPVTLADLGATILDLAGARSSTIPGSSLANYWKNPTFESPTPILARVTWDHNSPRRRIKTEGGMNSLVAGGLHYIRNADGTEELYAVADTMESRNLVTEPAAQETLKQLRRQLETLTRAGAR